MITFQLADDLYARAENISPLLEATVSKAVSFTDQILGAGATEYK